MKKMIAIILAAVCIISALALSGCTKNSNSQETAEKTAYNTLENVKKYVLEGKIDTAEFALGEKADKITSKYGMTAAENDEDETHSHEDSIVFDITEKSKYTRIICGANQYFYLNSDDDKRICVIACNADAFNFKIGNCYSDDVEYALGKPDTKDIPSAEDQIYSFVPIVNNITRMTYNFDKYRLDFIFIEDNLQNIVLTDTSIYKDMGHTQATTAKSADKDVEE